ncbi:MULTISPECIES: hypothetical protein [Halorussus]|uniref:hypothetical protein n=1 Tax=Halorussus TaxID=1070314 RepID=UPI000E214121|nr:MULTISPECIES: hypothetical protein [Halorussus]NHN60906.1 hypothetical protein [Halorussus sp. JP-T4]
MPLVARTTEMVRSVVGRSWLVGVRLGFGVGGAYAGILGYRVWMTLVVGAGFRWGDWAGRATATMRERGASSGRERGSPVLAEQRNGPEYWARAEGERSSADGDSTVTDM